MLDIRFIRENSELVEEKAKQKGYKVDINNLLEKYEIRNKHLREREDLKKRINEISDVSKRPSEEEIHEAKKLKEQLSNSRNAFRTADDEYIRLLKEVPNMPTDDVLVGTSEADNKVSKVYGEKPTFEYQPKTHWEIGEAHGWIDKERAAKVTGSRFAYLKGDLVRLQFALIQFALDTLTDEETIRKIMHESGIHTIIKPFVPILPPAMIRTKVFDNMDRLEPREERYRVGDDKDDLWLQGSAEHTLGPMYMDEVVPFNDLPHRYVGYATSFRREAGTYGKDTEGIIRMHQFDKLEMESFTRPEDGPAEHLLLIAIQEYLMQQLGLSYQVVNKCTADIGKPNARGVDIEVWLPGQDKYLETHTADYMTDYQSRRLKTRTKNKEEEIVFLHTNDATALAMGRTLVAIIENYQNQDGTIRVPVVLQPYFSDKTSF